MTTTNTRFTRRTLAVALAAGVSLGTVTVPQLAAVDGVAAIASAETRVVPTEGGLKLEMSPTNPNRALVIADETGEKSIRLYAHVGGGEVTHYLSSSYLKKMGLVVSKPFSIISLGDEHAATLIEEKGSPQTRKSPEEKPGLQIENWNTSSDIGLISKTERPVVFSSFAVIKQGEIDINVGLSTPTVTFNSPLTDVIKSGRTARVPAPYVNAKGVRFSIESPVNGASVDPETGALTYTPPKDFGGGYVEIDVTAAIDKEALGDTYISGEPYAATATYRFYVEPQPQSDLHVTVKDNGNGTYTLSKNDGSKPVTIKTKDGLQSVSQSGNTLTFTMADGSKKTVKVTTDSPVTITDNKNGTATISDGKTTIKVPTDNTYVTDVKKDKDGNYVVTRNDGHKWTIKLSDLRKRIDDLEGKDSPSRSEYDKLARDLKDAKDGIDGLKGKDAETDAAIKKLKDGLDGLDGRVSGLEGRVTAVENATIKKVVKNADGTYTLVRKDGSKVRANIGDPKEIKDVTANTDGSITVTHVNGTSEKVDLVNTKVTEANKGKSNHTITITTPGGKPLTFNVYDNYVVSINDLGDGKYALVRKDGTHVEGVIDTTDGSITNVKSDGKGNLVVTIDGKDQVVPLDKVKITEANKGTPEHTVTIAVPGGKSVTFGVFDRHVDNVAKQGRGKYVVSRNDGKKWTIDYSDLYATADGLKEKVADHEKRITALEEHDKVQDKKIAGLHTDVNKHTRELERVNTEIREITETIEANAADTDEKFKQVNGRIDKVRKDLGLLELRVTSLEGRMALVEGRLDGVEDVQDKWAKCYSGAGIAALPIALSIPLYVLSQTHIPQVESINSDIQKQIGIFNPELATMWRQQGGILQVTAALAGLAGTIGAIAYAANECKPYSETDAASKTPLGQLSSKVSAGSSRGEDAEPSETPGE